MDATKTLYYEDPFLREFTARVVSCAEVKGGWAVVLDATAFYPEGGGQGADHGTLTAGESAAQNAVNVLDVHEKGGVVTHLCDALEDVVSKELWPYPSYGNLLYRI